MVSVKKCLRALSCGRRSKSGKREKKEKEEEKVALTQAASPTPTVVQASGAEGSPRFRYHSGSAASRGRSGWSGSANGPHPVGSIKSQHIGPVPSPSRAPSHLSSARPSPSYMIRKDALIKDLRAAASQSTASHTARSISRARSLTPVLTPRNPDASPASAAPMPSVTMATPQQTLPQSHTPCISQPRSQVHSVSQQPRTQSQPQPQPQPQLPQPPKCPAEEPEFTDVLDELLKKRQAQPHRFVDTETNVITTTGRKGAVPPGAQVKAKAAPPPAPPRLCKDSVQPPPPPPEMEKILKEIQERGAAGLRPVGERAVALHVPSPASPIWEGRHVSVARSASPVGCPSTSLPRTSRIAVDGGVQDTPQRQSIQRTSESASLVRERSEPPALLTEAWKGPVGIWRQDNDGTHEVELSSTTTTFKDRSGSSPLALEESVESVHSVSTSSMPPFVVAAGVSPVKAKPQPRAMPPAPPQDVVTLRLDHGDEYKGTVKGGVPHGKGVMKYTNGNSYEGCLRDGLKWGRGLFLWRNGDCYKGEFVKDVFHGHGTFTFASSAQTYTGLFRSGMFVGPMPEGGTQEKAASDPGMVPPSQAPSPSVHYPFYHHRSVSTSEERGVVQLDLSAPDAEGLAPYWPDLPWQDQHEEIGDKPRGAHGLYTTLQTACEAP